MPWRRVAANEGPAAITRSNVQSEYDREARCTVDMIRGGFRAVGEAWRLTKPYLCSQEKWRAYRLLAAVMVLNLITVYGQVLNTYWFKYVYNALQRKEAGAFWALAVTYQRVPEFPYLIPGFLAIGVILTVASTYAVYLQQMLQIDWWRWLTENFVGDWMAGRAYYQLALKGHTNTSVDNPDQRIAVDLNDFVASNLALAISFVTNIVLIVSYVGILWSASSPMHFLGTHVPGYLVWVALLYSGLGTLIAHLIGRKLIDLNFLQQRYQADMRFNLVRIRENTTQIALYGGEQEEVSGVMRRFEAIRLNWWTIMRRTKAFNFFALGFTNFAIFVALIVGAPDFFAGIISLGALMLINSSFGNMQTAFSWFIGSYQQIVTWRATVQRLGGFERAVREVGAHGIHSGFEMYENGEELLAETLEINLPDGSPLFAQTRLAIGRGGPVVITGPSGSGKSILLRTFAGIWPFGYGRIYRPAGRLMFLPQKPYFPLGSLKEVVTYPRRPAEMTDESVRQAVADVGLARLADHLADTENWTLRLSGGEQQRLALARALVMKPDWLFLDEALSGLDDDAQHALFAMVRTRLPHTQLVSVVHRTALFALYPRRGTISSGETGTMRLTLEEVVPGQ